MTLQTVGRRLFWSCNECPHVVSAMTEPGLKQAMDDHAAFVNQTKDRETDPHFAVVRMDQLLAEHG